MSSEQPQDNEPINLTNELEKAKNAPPVYPRYQSRNGRSWLRKSDPACPQKPGSDMLIGIQAIAKFLGVSYPTASKLIHKYGMPAMALGDRRYRIHPESILRWMEAYSESMSVERQYLIEKRNSDAA